MVTSNARASPPKKLSMIRALTTCVRLARYSLSVASYCARNSPRLSKSTGGDEAFSAAALALGAVAASGWPPSAIAAQPSAQIEQPDRSRALQRGRYRPVAVPRQACGQIQIDFPPARPGSPGRRPQNKACSRSGPSAACPAPSRRERPGLPRRRAPSVPKRRRRAALSRSGSKAKSRRQASLPRPRGPPAAAAGDRPTAGQALSADSSCSRRLSSGSLPPPGHPRESTPRWPWPACRPTK